MARPLRIQYPGAWYHVMNRGRRRENIFKGTSDYNSFLKLIKDSSIMFTVHISGYCLMRNHYHILLQTPNANLSRIMRHIDGIYTQQFNRKYHLDGPLFRGRYKSILIEDDSHLLEVLRYVHRNPLKAGLEKKLGAYPWYSYPGYLSDSFDWEWLYSGFIVSMLSHSKEEARQQYIDFMAKESAKEVNALFKAGKQPVIFGSHGFKERIKKLFSKDAIEPEIPESRVLTYQIEQIIMAVCKYYHITKDELLITRRGFTNEARNMAVFLVRRFRGEALHNIAKCFEIKNYSSVSSIVTRFQQLLDGDKVLRKKRDEILAILREN